MEPKYLLVGLGNPGRKYQGNRHNLGFMVVDKAAELLQTRFKSGRGEYLMARGRRTDKHVLLLKPLTYMNRSGVAVADAVRRFDILLPNLLVILDDINLPFGRLRLRKRGSDGGHNGLASVIYSLRSEDFPRLRIGVTNDTMRDTVRFVLSDFNRTEKKELPAIVDRAAEACMEFVEHGIEQAMNKYNPG